VKWLMVSLLVGIVGCSAVPGQVGQSALARQQQPAATAAPAKPAAAAPAGGVASVANEKAARSAAPAQPPAAQTSEGYLSTAAADRPWDRMIIRNATLGLQVENVERALGAARQIAGKHGGFVSGSNQHLNQVGDREQMSATVTLQVRAQAFDAAVSELRGLAVKVESEVGTSQDVTEEYVDLDANLRNLQKTEATLVGLMEKATKLEDVLVLQRELTNVRSQIERIQGRKTFLERRSDMSQVTLNLKEADAVASSRPTGGAWDPVATAQRGWQASLRVLRTVADVAILSLAFGWWLIPLAAVGGAVLYRRRPRPEPV
jgi:hypothetical protein